MAYSGSLEANAMIEIWCWRFIEVWSREQNDWKEEKEARLRWQIGWTVMQRQQKPQVVSQGAWTLQCHLELKPEVRHLHPYINQSRDARFPKGEEREYLVKKPLPQRTCLEMDACVVHQPIRKIMSSVLKGDLIDVPRNPLAITKV